MLISVKSLVQIAFYTIIIAALVGINLNQLSLTKADEESPITAPITSPATPAPTSEPSQPSNNSGGGGGSGNSGPFVCGDQKPGTPVLLSVVKTGPNQVKLTWSKPVGPVTAYTLNYGLSPTKMLFGDPGVGNTNSYVVNQLDARTAYYFQIRAANGCTPGEASNTVGINAFGKVLGIGSKPAVNGIARLKGVIPKVNINPNTPKPSATPETNVNTTISQPSPAPAQEVKVIENNTPKSLLDDIVYRVIRFFYR